MEITKGFYDLNVPYQKNENELVAILNELYDGMYTLLIVVRFVYHAFPFTHSFNFSVCVNFQLDIEQLQLMKHLITQNVIANRLTYFLHHPI